MEIIKKKNGTSYREKVYVNGQIIHGPRFARKTDAKNWKVEILSRKSEPELVTKLQIESMTFNEYARTWLQKIQTRNSYKTHIDYSSVCRVHLLPLFGHRLLSELSLLDGELLINKLKKQGHNEKGINLILAKFKSILREAYEAELILKNPLVRLRPLREPPRSEAYWTKLEAAQFLRSQIKDSLYPVYIAALNTGMRRGEIAGLCWDRIDFQRNQIEISRTRDRYGLKDNTKTSLKRFVPINFELKQVLLEQFKKQFHPHFVFCVGPNQPFAVQHLYRSFVKAQKEAGLHNIIRFHDLRHTFASQFMMSGGNLFDLQKILGHSKTEMTMRYAHLSPDHLVNAINIISFSGNTEQNREQIEKFSPVLALKAM